MLNRPHGFTLVEVLVVMAVMVMIVVFAPIIFSDRQVMVVLDTASSEMLSVLRQAQGQSVSGKNDSRWGVYFDKAVQNQYVLYAGIDYQTRDVIYDKTVEMGSGITWSIDGVNSDINFSSQNGFPNTEATIIIKHESKEQGVEININSIGKIERNEE